MAHEIKIFKKCFYRGNCFEKSFYVAKYHDDIIIYVILTIVQTKNGVYFFGQQLDDVQYNPHYIAYEISTEALGEFFLIPVKDIIGPPLNIVNTACGKKMIRIKAYYSTF